MKAVVRWKKQILCAAVGLALAAFAQALQNGSSRLTSLERPDFEGEEQQILVEGLGEEGIPLEVQISPRQYKPEEARALYQQILEELPGRILGENASLSQVEHDLELIREIPEYGVSLKWESSRPEFVDSYGRVNRQGMGEEKEEVWLRVELTDSHTSETYQLQAWVLPETTTPQENALLQLKERLKEEDYAQRYSPVLKLPEELEGKALAYRSLQEPVFASIAFLGVAAALMLVVKERSDREREIKERKNQLLLDYPELLSKMMIFLGAGMTARNAWEQMTEDYLRLRKLGKREKRWVYEEMYAACGQMKRGIPEGQAYLEFGRRCGLPCYTKFAGFLEQSRKNGAKNLREHLRLEMEEAYEQRKHEAKRLGEEASTKLLLPLFLMLGVVMVMVAVPAMLEFM